MEDKVIIDGVSYVREDKVLAYASDNIEYNDISITWFNGAVYEDTSFCFQASVLTEPDGGAYGDLAIEFTDKVSKDRDTWEEHYLDNPLFFKGLMENDPEANQEAMKIMNMNQLFHLKSFLKKLEENGGWFSEND
jgi:hypothetical protein